MPFRLSPIKSIILMFSPRQRYIDYRITKPCGTSIHIPVVLNEQGLAAEKAAAVGEAEYMGKNCTDCEVHHGCCKAENALSEVIKRFDDLKSTDFIHAEVQMEGRQISMDSQAPRALASLMGLLMASSGCPRLIPFRAMALFHLPFATAEENAIRAAGFWLMRCWTQNMNLAENPFTALQVAWDSLEEVNQYLSRKLLAQTSNDAASNGIAFLDVLAKMGTMGLDSALETLRPVLNASASAELPDPT